MFKAVKHLKKKSQGIQFIHNASGQSLKQPQAIYDEIERHFKNHFSKENLGEIQKFHRPPQKLRKEITPEEVKKAVNTMSNNKAPGEDKIPVELIKYASDELNEEISIVINIFRNNDTVMKMGTGILIPLPKPGKTKGPVKNLRPVTLLEVIRKILSKILMHRTEMMKIDGYLANSQSAYRKGRSTTDIVWAHRWIAAKAQEQDISVHITGIDMSSAFDTIYKEELLEIANFLQRSFQVYCKIWSTNTVTLW